jgi:hypothetical protein
VIGQSCLHSPAKIVVERQSQPTGSSLSALEPRQIVRKPRGRTVLPAAAYCAKDPRAALNRQTHPSNMPLMAPDRAPSEVTQSVCLQSPTSPFVFGPAGCSTKALTIHCRSHVGKYRPFLSQISLDQGGRLLPEPNCAGKLTGKPPTRNSSAAQLGKSQPRRHKAFLRLARSQRIEALPRQTDAVVITDEALS